MKSGYMISCAVAALLSGTTGVLADNAPADTNGPSTGVEEVIVTAERREENIEKVPMTLQAFTGADLADLNVNTLEDILKYTPSVTYGNNGPGQGEIFMRGLSTGFRGDQSTGTVGLYPERRDLSRRPVDAVPRPQRRHLHGRHAAGRSAGRPAGHAVRRRRRSRRAALHHQQAGSRPSSAPPPRACMA